MDTNLNQKSQDANSGVLPFKITIPLVKYVLENGRKVIRHHMGIIYHLVGFTKGRDHAKLLRIEMEAGDVDPDILPVLLAEDAIEKVEEYEEIAAKKVNSLYWNENNLTVAQ